MNDWEPKTILPISTCLPVFQKYENVLASNWISLMLKIYFEIHVYEYIKWKVTSPCQMLPKLHHKFPLFFLLEFHVVFYFPVFNRSILFLSYLAVKIKIIIIAETRILLLRSQFNFSATWEVGVILPDVSMRNIPIANH